MRATEAGVVHPSYVLGVTVNRPEPGQTSTRIVGNYLRGRLPAIVDSYTNIVDVEDVVRAYLAIAGADTAPGEAFTPRASTS